MEKLEYIDFYEKKKSLHYEMLSEIKKMFIRYNISGIDFTAIDNDSIPKPFIILSPDGCSSTYETNLEKVIYDNGLVRVVIADSEKPLSLATSDSVVLCCLETLYDAVYHYTSRLPETSIEKLNHIEQAVLSQCKKNADEYGEYGGFCYDEVDYKSLGLTAQQMKGYLSQLCQKGYIEKLEDGYYFTHNICNYNASV